MNSYVLTLVLKPDLDEKARKEILDLVTKQFGKVSKEEIWGARDLSYPIKRQKKGYYAHYQFESAPDTIAGLDKSLKLEEDIIRYLLIREK